MLYPPPEAVTVMVEAFAAAVEPANSVNILVPAPGEAMLLGAKLAVMPVGSPTTDIATAELNPFSRAVVNVMGIEPPGATLALVALGIKVKLGARMVRLRVCVLVTPPPDAVTTKLDVPAATVEPAESTSVLVPVPGEAMLAGVKLAVTPVGRALMENTTAELNPLSRAVVNVTEAEPPRATLKLEAPGVRLKLGARTVRAKV